MSKRLVVASNRLPLVLEQVDGAWQSRAGSGGLVTALNPVLRQRGGLWVGWPGTIGHEAHELDDILKSAGREAGYEFSAVMMSAAERDSFYYGFSNEIIWPLFHDLHMRCNYDPAYWGAYRAVNRRFAEVIARNIQPGDFIWVQDYHLMSVAADLRELGVTEKIGFFLHIPFPPPEIFMKLPWRFEILQALLQFDVLGFQTQGYRRSFSHCVRSMVPGLSVRGRGRVMTAKTPDRDVQVGVFPISIDFHEFADKAAAGDVIARTAEIRRQFDERKLILGVDRLDYTKGIPERLRAFDQTLIQHPELCDRVTLVQVVVPSRTAIGEYKDLKSEIEMLVGEINGRHSRPGWTPVHYAFRSLERSELIAYYRAADAMLVTPLRDGMNLVAKEYCACRTDNDGVLILSEFAGTAATMHRGALLVNPHDVVGAADAIYHGLTMEENERRARMQTMRREVRGHDVFWWLDTFLQATGESSAPGAATPTPLEHDLLNVAPPTAQSPQMPSSSVSRSLGPRA